MNDKLAVFVSKLKQHPVASVAIALSVVLLLVLFVRSSRLSEVEQALTEAEAEWNRIGFNLKRSHNLERHVEQVQAIAAEIEERLLNPADVAINYDYFYRLERETGVRLITLNQTGVVDPSGRAVPGLPPLKTYSAIGYTMGVEGSFPDILRFLSEIGNGRFLARISAVNLSTTANAETASLITANVQCEILGKPQ